MISFEFTVTNQGPDTIFQTDTLFYTSGHSFKLRNSEIKIPIPQIIAPGDSIVINDTISVNSGKTKADFNVFFIQVPMTYGPDKGKLKLTNEFSEDRDDNNPILVLNHIGNANAPTLTKSSGKMYPNPVTGGKLFLKEFNNISSITLYNANMQSLRSDILTANNDNSIVFTHVSPGMYFIQVVDDSGLFVEKLIIQ